MNRIILALVAVTILAACQKKQCWQCASETIQTTTGPGLTTTQTIVDTARVCDKTVDEIAEYEKGQNKESTQVQDSFTVHTIQKTVCDK